MTRAYRKKQEALRAERKHHEKPEFPEMEERPVPEGIEDALRLKAQIQTQLQEQLGVPVTASMSVYDGEWVFIVRCSKNPPFRYFAGHKVFWMRSHSIGPTDGIKLG